jgi:hypothetical protein
VFSENFSEVSGDIAGSAVVTAVIIIITTIIIINLPR